METIHDNVCELIGNTPLIRLRRFASDAGAEVVVKMESFNPGSSVKDRIALAMIETAEKRGLLREGSTIIEPTSGNTGIGLAMVAAVKGYPIMLVMPESMSVERRKLLQGLGARVNLIRFHSIPDSSLQPASDEEMVAFQNMLKKKGIRTTIRASRGQDIQAACGLLSTRKLSSSC